MGATSGFVSVSAFSELDASDYKEVTGIVPTDTVAALCYTSGTTGLPKGVEISHYSFVANLHTSKACLSSNEEDVLLAWNPITHASGFVYTMVAACIGSTCVIVSPALRFEQIVDYVDRYKKSWFTPCNDCKSNHSDCTVFAHQVTTFASFPTRLRQIVGEMLRRGVRLDSVRKINVGGSVVSPSLAEAVCRAFGDLRCLRNLYALTESCGIVCSPPTDEISAGYLGYPAPMVEIKIIDTETGEKLGPNESGELCYRIPSTMKGYYNKPEATAEFFDQEGWCHSGDMCYYDVDGRFYFVERLKELIRCMDNQVAPAELEELILKAGGECLAEVAVAGVPHHEYGEAAAAYVVLATGCERVCTEDIVARIKKAVAESCAPHKHLYGGVHFVERLPRTETGKVKRKALCKA
ncbi:hypothetical protein V5799_003281 [Amblyomma americanum]|uniref:Acyl-coa synthetase n=1 Tax=Amblyomma americanum TaxID=6943 RepID=A0AAQ4D9E9_AMBAM